MKSGFRVYCIKGLVVPLNDYLNAGDVELNETADAILEALGEQVQQNAEGVYLLDMQRAREFITCYREMKSNIHGSRVKIGYAMDELIPGCATIRIESKGFRVRNTERFANALRLASNYEIYPKTNGNTMLTITFYGLKTKIGE